jgi:hypothetical protein
MTSTLFNVSVMLPSFVFALLVLATFYGVGRAYVALSWVPAAAYALTCVMGRLSVYHASAADWPALSQAVALTGMAQCAVGVALLARAARRREGCFGLLLGSCLTAVPFVLGV